MSIHLQCNIQYKLVTFAVHEIHHEIYYLHIIMTSSFVRENSFMQIESESLSFLTFLFSYFVRLYSSSLHSIFKT